MISVATKTCGKCAKAKPLADFYANPRVTDGHDSICKSCRRARQRTANFRRYQPFQPSLDPELIAHRQNALMKNVQRIYAELGWDPATFQQERNPNP